MSFVLRAIERCGWLLPGAGFYGVALRADPSPPAPLPQTARERGDARTGLPCAWRVLREATVRGTNPRLQSAQADFVMFQPRFQPPEAGSAMPHGQGLVNSSTCTDIGARVRNGT
jgi:hypothetical protein